VKEAETDAMKRALMTFGNPFGLALYDKDQTNVADSNGHDPKGRFVLECQRSINRFDDPDALVRWWNAESNKQSRRDLRLTRAEIDDLKGMVLDRKAQLIRAG